MHELVLDVPFGKHFLLPMTLEVPTIAKITGISEKFTVHAGQLLNVIEEAYIITRGQVSEPPSNVRVEFVIESYPVVKICGSHGCLYQVVKKSPAWSADTAGKVRFPH